MPLDLHCPSCGHDNAAGATACSVCNFPLEERAGAAAAEPSPAGTPAADPESEPVRAFTPDIRSIRPIRPRPPRPPQEALQLQLWLVFGAIAGAVVLYTGWKGFQKSNPPPAVAGARENQQQIADVARATLARDSTNLNARLALANVLYDTANWPDAIVQYKAAARLDSTRAETFVDEGVCYYNLSASEPAEALFRKALSLEPHQPVALFNLGIVTETRGDAKKALEYYHQAMQASPPEAMKQPLMDAMQRIMQKTGQKAPAIPGLGDAPAQPK